MMEQQAGVLPLPSPLLTHHYSNSHRHRQSILNRRRRHSSLTNTNPGRFAISASFTIAAVVIAATKRIGISGTTSSTCLFPRAFAAAASTPASGVLSVNSPASTVANKRAFLGTSKIKKKSERVRTCTSTTLETTTSIMKDGECISTAGTSMDSISNSNHTDVIGGGAINEKFRGDNTTNATAPSASAFLSQSASSTTTNFDPRHNLSHLLHSLVGLDRYPNYLSRWTQEQEGSASTSASGSASATDDMDQLELALQEQLAKVQRQRVELQTRREGIQALVQEVIQSLDLESESELVPDDDDDDEARIEDSSGVIRTNKTTMPFPLRPPKNWTEVKERVLHPDAVRHIFQSKCFKKQGHAQTTKSKKSNLAPALTVENVLRGNVNVTLDAGQLQLWMEEELFDVYSIPLLSQEVSTAVIALHTNVCRY
jgi:hypothetical protein